MVGAVCPKVGMANDSASNQRANHVANGKGAIRFMGGAGPPVFAAARPRSSGSTKLTAGRKAPGKPDRCCWQASVLSATTTAATRQRRQIVPDEKCRRNR